MSSFSVTPGKPFGTMLEPVGPNLELGQVAPDQLRELIREHRIVVLRGFRAFAQKEELVEYARRWGPLLSWNFGDVLDLEIHEDPKDYVFTAGPVPYHWDGAFAAQVPTHQIFQCVKAPVAGGRTVFCDTGLVLDGLPAATRQIWDGLTITYRKEKTAHYGGNISADLIQRHPHTGEQVVRYAEPLDPAKFLSPLFLDVAGLPEDVAAEAFFADIEERLYAPEVTYYHEWQDGDYVVTDNHALLHGRTAFTAGSARHLRRVHVL
ncbi:TauD/TfdA dioxygenase family protein [Micromonospora matsumotoense]|uniref:TauD/TfdA dioxygenase family protein n=1 Tax=Micromonospora matsumotoense TaxID=121616 RepID=UPI003D8B0E5E